MVSKHAGTRSVERYGHVISEDEDARIVSDISNGHCLFLVGDKEIANFAVLIDNKAVPVVFAKKSKKLVTVLPRKAMFSMMTKQLHRLRGDDEL
jgi:hypothetical protein